MKPLVLVVPRSPAKRKRGGEVGHDEERAVLRELDRWIDTVNRPRVVLDCSELDVLGLSEVRFLLSCLERVLKRNGDARLAGLSAPAKESLSNTGAERLFRIYDSSESAVRSFDSHPNLDVFGERLYGSLRQVSGDSDGQLPPSPIQYTSMRKSGDVNEDEKQNWRSN